MFFVEKVSVIEANLKKHMHPNTASYVNVMNVEKVANLEVTSRDTYSGIFISA